jgi:hypothetical protein
MTVQFKKAYFVEIPKDGWDLDPEHAEIFAKGQQCTIETINGKECICKKGRTFEVSKLRKEGYID